MKMHLNFTCFTVSMIAAGCGATDKTKTLPLETADLQAELSAQAASEAVSAAAGGDVDGASGLGLASHLDSSSSASPIKSLSRTCVQQADGSALVTITSEISSEKTSGNAKVSRSNKLLGKSVETRTWSNSGGAVSCSSGERAQINWKGALSGYSLKVHLERDRQQTMTQSNLAKNISISRSRSFSVLGDRTVSLVSYSEDSAAGVSIQEKQVSGKMARSFKFIDKNGQEQSGSITTESVGDPMSIKVRRSLSSKEVVSREIVSGTRLSTAADGSKVILSFTNFLMKGEGESCEPQSGSFVLKNTDASGAAAKDVTCTADSGSLSCVDSAGASVEIENPSCDPIDGK
ncbi:hypothetical protein EBU99_13030 [bacterium]|nr:hypothetical protein [bacterium]